MGIRASKLPPPLPSQISIDKTLPAFAPPTSWEGRRTDVPPPCKCLADPIAWAKVAKMDPLIAAGFHNLTCSPLCRLPKELLLSIIERLDILSIQCLRRASRLFLRLYCSPVFSDNHIREQELDDYSHWNAPKAEDNWPKALAALLDKDVSEYCGHCRKMRIEGKKSKLMTDYLHCSGCFKDHPRCLFSKVQWSKPAKKRICIGREEFIRLCDHQVLTWDTVIRTGLQLAKVHTKKDTFAEVCLAQCKHESHFPQHHNAVPSFTDYQTIYPKIGVFKDPVSGKIHVCLEWHGHLLLPQTGLGEQGNNEAVSPKRLRQQLEQFRQGRAEFVAPEFPPGRLTEMNCFDPNRCSCLRYAGMEQLPRGWQLTQHLLRFSACRQNTDNRLGPLLAVPDDKQQSSNDKKHFVAADMTKIQACGYSRIRISIEPCPVESRCLQILYYRFADITTAGHKSRMSWAWCQMLDPHSYNLLDDMESLASCGVSRRDAGTITAM